MSWKTLDDMTLEGKRVLVRVDINVPVENGAVTDTTRIERIVPTIQDILSAGGTPVLLAHFGRPKGKYVPEMSLRVTLPALEAALGQEVIFVERPDPASLDALPSGSVVLVENTRFAAGEEANDPQMAQERITTKTPSLKPIETQTPPTKNSNVTNSHRRMW